MQRIILICYYTKLSHIFKLPSHVIKCLIYKKWTVYYGKLFVRSHTKVVKIARSRGVWGSIFMCTANKP